MTAPSLLIYVASDIPAGMTIADWRDSRVEQGARRPRRRGLRRLLRRAFA